MKFKLFIATSIVFLLCCLSYCSKRKSAEDYSLIEKKHKANKNRSKYITSSFEPLTTHQVSPKIAARSDLPYDRMVKNGLPGFGVNTIYAAPEGNSALRRGVQNSNLEHVEYKKDATGVGVQPPGKFLHKPIIVDDFGRHKDQRRHVWRGGRRVGRTLSSGISGYRGFGRSQRSRIAKRGGIAIRGLGHYTGRGGGRTSFGRPSRSSFMKGYEGATYGHKNNIKGKNSFKRPGFFYDRNKPSDSFAHDHFGVSKNNNQIDNENVIGGESSPIHPATHHEQDNHDASHSASKAFGGQVGGVASASMGNTGHGHGRSFIETEQVIKGSYALPTVRHLPGGNSVSKRHFIPKPLHGPAPTKWGTPGVTSTNSNNVRKHTMKPGRIGFKRNYTPNHGPPGVISRAHNNGKPEKAPLRKRIGRKGKKGNRRGKLEQIRGPPKYGEWQVGDPSATNEHPRHAKKPLKSPHKIKRHLKSTNY